ncbi:MAG: putative Na+/H+ antiporter [Vicinamibacterales bacterium]
MFEPSEGVAALPRPLDSYGDAGVGSLVDLLQGRVEADPFNLVATVIFACAIFHTFVAARVTQAAHHLQHAADERARAEGVPPRPSVAAEILHFFGEVEVVFGIWSVVLLGAMSMYAGFGTAERYFGERVNYTEPMFVVVIMSLASTRPIVLFAERSLHRIAKLGEGTPAAWWLAILTIGPLLGSFITEPAAMTICALLLARQFYDLGPSVRLRYATLGLLFVNVSIGGTLTHFAAPPVLMVARAWEWDMLFMLGHFGWRAVIAIAVSTTVYFLWFRSEFAALSRRPARPDEFERDEAGSPESPRQEVPGWITAVHMAFMAWTVMTAHYPALFVGGFLFFLGFAKATADFQGRLDLRAPLLVGFFLGGLVIHGGLQAWWIAPVLSRLAEAPLFFAATLLTAFNDNAMITYLASLVPSLSESLKVAVVEGAVTGGGLTVIANAPNPAGQALLSRFFPPAVEPLKLALGAIPATLIVCVAFRLI